MDTVKWIFGGLIFVLGILNSGWSDASKYFAITLLLIVIVIVYIQMAVVERIEILEEKMEKSKKKEDKR